MRMQQALKPPPRTQMNVALQASGAIIGTGWQRSLFANLDAFLAMARSVPAIIEACFGADLGSAEMRTWFNGLGSGEQYRRKEFTRQFELAYAAFRALALSNKRNVSFHRTGVTGA